ncbi:HD domain-containing phosphohydrolase [Halomonas salifodinae]|uniref:HD domain-containing phosphohydrolase n=1 Tax=Halomonas salifodinae TaxID=438745 RepID=A0ABW2EZC9_9GAMM
MMFAASTAQAATVLLVDDEPNVLSAIKRELRHEPYRLLMAESGEAALELLAEEDIDLVISDAIMPGMDGAQLLAEIQQRRPSCVRILLTGKADLSATIRAINEGHIYRYIAKPWDDHELLLTLRHALSHLQSERERRRLEALTQAQNEELLALNADLERRVAARTEELQQTADMLDAAYGELKQSYVITTRVFSTLINQRLPRSLQTNAQVGRLVRAFADDQGLDESLRHDLEMAAALYNLGRLSWDDQMLTTPAQRLYAKQQSEYRRYPEAGEALLMTLEPLQGAARLIRHHREYWNGSGYPDRLRDETIPYGARLLGLAVDFIELQRGMILPRQVSRPGALELLQKLAGRVYDPELCRAFIALCQEQAPDLGLQDARVMTLDTRQVEPGMVLVQDLHSTEGMLLINHGKALTASLIERLIRFEETEGASYTLIVRPAESEEEV